MKTSELIGPALDWAVAKCEGLNLANLLVDESRGGLISLHDFHMGMPYGFTRRQYSTDWAQGGPIIEKKRMSISPAKEDWTASLFPHKSRGLTPLIAAMRCYVASKLGDEVEIPEELR